MVTIYMGLPEFLFIFVIIMVILSFLIYIFQIVSGSVICILGIPIMFYFLIITLLISIVFIVLGVQSINKEYNDNQIRLDSKNRVISSIVGNYLYDITESAVEYNYYLTDSVTGDVYYLIYDKDLNSYRYEKVKVSNKNDKIVEQSVKNQQINDDLQDVTFDDSYTKGKECIVDSATGNTYLLVYDKDTDSYHYEQIKGK